MRWRCTASSLLRSVPIMLALASNAHAVDVTFTLTGRQEVKQVATAASGTGLFKIGDKDKTISGTVKTSSIVGVAAHVHIAPMGKNGPPILTLNKVSDSEWSVPEGAKLTDEQHVAFKAGELYVNVHTVANKRGEIRGQIIPPPSSRRAR